MKLSDLYPDDDFVRLIDTARLARQYGITFSECYRIYDEYKKRCTVREFENRIIETLKTQGRER